METITDPHVLAAFDFIDRFYAKLGHMAPKNGSVEEQHAIRVLAAYIKDTAERQPQIPGCNNDRQPI